MSKRQIPPSFTGKDNLQFAKKLGIFPATWEWIFLNVRTEKKSAMDAYLKLLETAKEQYQQYVEIRQLFELVDGDDEPEKSQPPSPENPSTTNKIILSLAD